MSNGTINGRGKFLDIVVPAIGAQAVIDRIQASEKYCVDAHVWQDEAGCHIRIILKIQDEANCFKFLTRELGLIDRTLK